MQATGLVVVPCPVAHHGLGLCSKAQRETMSPVATLFRPVALVRAALCARKMKSVGGRKPFILI